MINTEKELITYLQEKENIYLFGAGKRAERCLYYCGKSGIRVDGLLVSKREENPLEKDGKPVLALDELKDKSMATEELNVIVTLAGGMKKWLGTFCEMPRFKSILFISDKLWGEISLSELKYQFEDKQDKYQLAIEYPKVESGQGFLIERESGQVIMRMPLHARLQMLQPLLVFGTREEFEREFGPLSILPCVKNTGIEESIAREEKLEIYVVTSHLDKAKAEDIQPGGYLPIQVGAALTEVRKGCITDDTGDNISVKNKDYCECTGLYWIWKNTHGQNYVGLNHYRRRLMLDDNSVQYLKEQEVDLVAAHPQFEKEIIKDYFSQYICQQDWSLLKQKVIDYDESYASCFERYENGHFYFPCNVALWKRKWFDKYCEFAFDVAGKIDSFYRERGIVREDRYMGYLFEQLSTIFIMRHYKEMNVVCSQIEWVN